MKKYNFDGYSEQQAEHAQFIKDFSLLKRNLKHGVLLRLWCCKPSGSYAIG